MCRKVFRAGGRIVRIMASSVIVQIAQATSAKAPAHAQMLKMVVIAPSWARFTNKGRGEVARDPRFARSPRTQCCARLKWSV